MQNSDLDTAGPLPSTPVGSALNGKEMADTLATQFGVLPEPIHAATSPRVGGQWKGRVEISADFDELPEDLALESEGEG